jgi:hypothetical protein
LVDDFLFLEKLTGIFSKRKMSVSNCSFSNGKILAQKNPVPNNDTGRV